MGPVPGEERFETLNEFQDRTTLGAELGFSQVDEDYFLTLRPRFDLNFGNFGLGLQIPLNLRVIDKSPKNDNDYGGIIRAEDWDEPSEYFRAVRWLRYGHPRDFVYFRVGGLDGELGNGTIMGR